MAEFTALMSQVITDFTQIDTTITAEYSPATGDAYGFLLFGIQIEKGFEVGVNFSSSVSLGDFSTITVEESSLILDGSFFLSNEFGVILGPNPDQALKITSQINDANCTDSDQNVDFDIILYHDNDPPVAHNISVTSCVEGVSARVDNVRNRINAAVPESVVTVSLVGSATLILAFDPYWSKVVTYAPKHNIYGLTNDTQKKGQFYFANGATELEIGLGLSGGATVSATVLDTIEVAASIDASISGSLQFNSGTSRQLESLDTWFSNVKAMLNASDPFHKPGFARAVISVDGNFGASVEVREPFSLEVPASFDGSFAAPFELNLLNISAVNLTRPNITFKIDLPNIGDIKNLSFGQVVKLLSDALGFLIGESDSGDTVESCSGGLLGKEIFTYKIPVLGISACEFAGFLQIVVDAINTIVNDCTECEDSNTPKTSFGILEAKLSALLQDAVGGTPSIKFTPLSDEIRSSLDVDLVLQWSFQEASQLNIDLAAILDGLDLEDDLKNFAKGEIIFACACLFSFAVDCFSHCPCLTCLSSLNQTLSITGLIAFDGAGQTEIFGSISFSLGIGLEFIKKSRTIIPYLKGTTGVTFDFSANATAEFQASIGPLSATVIVDALIDNYGEPLSISVGLNPSVNYYISSDRQLSRNGFQRVPSMGALKEQITFAIKGQVAAEIEAEFLGGLGNAYMRIQISDINNIIQRKPGAVALYYKVSVVQKPSFLDILLMDPVAIVNAVDGLFKTVNDLTLGRQGIVTTFPMPFIGTAVSRSLKAGSSDNFLEKARRTVKGTLDGILTTYEVDGGDSTVADLIANVLTDLLGNRLGILAGDVTVRYYEHNTTIGQESLETYDNYNSELDVKSLMWEIPFGQTFTIDLPAMNFDLGNENFPLQIKTQSTEQPSLTLEWNFTLAFGFDEKDG